MRVTASARRWLPLAAVLSAVVASSGASAVPSGSDGGPAEVRYTFDGEPLGGRLHVWATAGGEVQPEPRDGGGLAVRFPPRCATYRGWSCPRVVLESSFDRNPGAGPLRFGAAVRMTADETAVGENVLQKGFAHGHSQFKLQVDGAAGRPSCVLVGTASRRIHVVTAGVSVANGQWHTVECVRAGSDLTVLVDGAIAGRTTVPASLSIVNGDPLRIGGKGLSPDNDQYHGAVDDVFVAIGG